MTFICITIFCVSMNYFESLKELFSFHAPPTSLMVVLFFFPFSSLPIDSEKNDRWRKWRKNIWNTGQIPRWGKLGTGDYIYRSKQNQKSTVKWCKDVHFVMSVCIIFPSRFGSFTGLHWKKLYTYKKKAYFGFVFCFFGASLIKQLLMRSSALFTRKWTQPTSVYKS